MHFFGSVGMLMFLFGGAVSFWLLLQKVIAAANNVVSREVTDQPLFYLAMLAMIIGTQLFLAGFLAEMIARTASDRNHYQIAETID
jgi:TRAP-type mannitol/chloroaromatic compound transport system permease small subunit